jgi:hypothetical protein
MGRGDLQELPETVGQGIVTGRLPRSGQGGEVSMTKAEKAEVERLKTALGLALALRFTDADEEPDIPAPEWGKETTGWAFNRYSLIVTQGWSASTCHGDGPARVKNGCASQGSVPLYSTKLRALRALRRNLERLCAEQLRAIDLQIEAALTPTRESDGK